MKDYADLKLIADAIEMLDWKGCSIGHKAILANAVAALRDAQHACSEPVAEVVSGYSGDPDTRGDRMLKVVSKLPELGTKLYAAPPTGLATQPGEWIHPDPLYPAENLYNQGFAAGAAAAKSLNATRSAN